MSDIRFSFSRELRLLSPTHFSYVFQRPHRVSMLKITILSRLNALKKPRIGLIVSKKDIKRAHERNRIKRLTRESFRLLQHELPSMDFVVVIKRGIDNLDNRTLTETLKNLWHYHCRLALRF